MIDQRAQVLLTDCSRALCLQQAQANAAAAICVLGTCTRLSEQTQTTNDVSKVESET